LAVALGVGPMFDFGLVGDAGFDCPAVLIHVERGDWCDCFVIGGGYIGAHRGCGGCVIVVASVGVVVVIAVIASSVGVIATDGLRFDIG